MTSKGSDQTARMLVAHTTLLEISCRGSYHNLVLIAETNAAQTSKYISTVLPEPLLLVYIKYGCRSVVTPKLRPLAYYVTLHVCVLVIYAYAIRY